MLGVDFYNFLGLIGGSSVAAIGVAKQIHEIFVERSVRSESGYRFAKEFLKDLEGDIHPFLKDRGYKVLSGNAEITSEEVAYLIELKEPVRALKNFSLGRNYLVLNQNEIGLFISFKEKYKNKWSRFWRKNFFKAIYFLACIASITPFVMLDKFGGIYGAVKQFLLFVLVLLPLGMIFLMKAIRIECAEELEREQFLHKGLIGLEKR